MKKIVTLFMAIALVLSLVACSSTKKTDETQDTTASDPKTETVAASAVELLSNVWSTYSEDELFSAVGGDSAVQEKNAPGKYSLTDTDGLNSVLGLPADRVAMVDDAASLVNMRNANTFTAGAFHLTDAGKLDEFENALKESITGRQWLCGFPDTLIIVNVNGDYVISAFGDAEMIETFKGKILAQYADAAKVDVEMSLFD